MKEWHRLLRLVPAETAWEPDWTGLEDTPLAPYILQMARTPQEPEWHGEGDVWTHTKLVCQALAERADFRNLSRRQQEIVFLSALLHDIAKPVCTRWEDNAWRSPNHTVEGEALARRILWQEFGLCGTQEKLETRECICALVRYHSIPGHLVDMKNAERRLLDMASLGKVIPLFSLELLRLVAEADNMGRISQEQAQTTEKLRQCFALAEKLGVLHGPLEQSEGADDRQKVIVVCGTSDDSRQRWIQSRYPDLPVVSERREMTHLLREQCAFVWNETEDAYTQRHKVLSMLAQKKVQTHIVYLESQYMPENTELPKPADAHTVEWICIDEMRT